VIQPDFRMPEEEYFCCRTYLISEKAKNDSKGQAAIHDRLCTIMYSLFIKAALQRDIIPIGHGSPPKQITAAIRVEKMVENGPTEVSVFGRNESDNQDDSYYETEHGDWDRGNRGKSYVSKSLVRESSQRCSVCGVKYAITIRRLHLDMQAED
jgi:hypothetical protein